MSAPLSAWGLPQRVEVKKKSVSEYAGQILEYSPAARGYLSPDKRLRYTVTFVHQLWLRLFFPENGQQMELTI